MVLDHLSLPRQLSHPSPRLLPNLLSLLPLSRVPVGRVVRLPMHRRHGLESGNLLLWFVTSTFPLLLWLTFLSCSPCQVESIDPDKQVSFFLIPPSPLLLTLSLLFLSTSQLIHHLRELSSWCKGDILDAAVASIRMNLSILPLSITARRLESSGPKYDRDHPSLSPSLHSFLSD
jgi:hypothetical protein